MGSNPTRAITFLLGGVAQTCRALACQARGRRFDSGRPRFRGGRGVDGSTRGCDPRWRRFEPGRPPSLADAEQTASSAGCNPVASCCGGSTPSVRTSWGCSSIWTSASLATRKMPVRLRPSPLTHSGLRSVNGKHAPFVRPRCGFDSCRRLLRTPVAQRRERCPATAEAAGSNPAGRTTSRT